MRTASLWRAVPRREHRFGVLKRCGARERPSRQSRRRCPNRVRPAQCAPSRLPLRIEPEEGIRNFRDPVQGVIGDAVPRVVGVDEDGNEVFDGASRERRVGYCNTSDRDGFVPQTPPVPPRFRFRQAPRMLEDGRGGSPEHLLRQLGLSPGRRLVPVSASSVTSTDPDSTPWTWRRELDARSQRRRRRTRRVAMPSVPAQAMASAATGCDCAVRASAFTSATTPAVKPARKAQTISMGSMLSFCRGLA